MKKRKKIIFIVIVLLLLLCIGGGLYLYFNSEPGEKIFNQGSLFPTPTPSPTPTLKIVNEYSKERSFAVMIDNNVGNNNHAGLLDAYLTYEIIVEGGLSRIMAIFKDTDTSLIGPVRSSRHYFLDYALENDSIYSHFGWSTFAETDIKVLKVNNINGMTNGGSAYWRDKKIAAPHNVFTTISNLKEQATRLGYTLTTDKDLLLKYSIDPIDLSENLDKQTATTIVVKYSPSQNRSYTYNEETKMYLRSMNNKAHTDKETGQQLSYKNVIVQQITNKSLDNVGHQDLKNIGTGDGYFLTDGYAIPIKWTKDSRKNQTKYTYLDGTEVQVNDGRTFIQIVPLTQAITIN